MKLTEVSKLQQQRAFAPECYLRVARHDGMMKLRAQTSGNCLGTARRTSALPPTHKDCIRREIPVPAVQTLSDERCTFPPVLPTEWQRLPRARRYSIFSPVNGVTTEVKHFRELFSQQSGGVTVVQCLLNACCTITGLVSFHVASPRKNVRKIITDQVPTPMCDFARLRCVPRSLDMLV